MPAPSFVSETRPSAIRRAPIGWRAVIGLTLLVLAAHLSALRGGALSLTPQPPPAPVATLQVRQIAAPASPQPVAKPPAAVSRRDAPKKQANRQSPQVAPAQIAPDSIATIPPSSAEPSATITPDPAPIDAAPAAPAAAGPAETAAAPAPIDAPPNTAVPTAIALPASVQLVYKMSGSAEGLSYQASAELDWNHSGDRYETSMTVSALFLGSRSMASRGAVGPGGLAPERFADKSRKRELATHFDADKRQITFSSNAPAAAWLPGAQDRLSVFMQLAGMLAGDPAAFPLGTLVSIYTAGPRGAEMWRFLVEAEELITVPAGEMVALKLTSQLRNDYDRRLEIWYAPSLRFLPVRFRYAQANNDFIDQQLRSVNPR